MRKRAFLLALLASALWGSTYPLLYLAQASGNQLALATALVSLILVPRRIRWTSLLKGLVISPLNYALLQLTAITVIHDIGLAAALASSYPVLVFAIESAVRGLDHRLIVSGPLLVVGLILIHGGGDSQLLLGLAFMLANALYVVLLEVMKPYDPHSVFLGQNLGTLLMAAPTARMISLEPWLVAASLALTLPSLLYLKAQGELTPSEVSVASSVEPMVALLSSLPILGVNHLIAVILLAISVISAFLELGDDVDEEQSAIVIHHREIPWVWGAGSIVRGRPKPPQGSILNLSLGKRTTSRILFLFRMTIINL